MEIGKFIVFEGIAGCGKRKQLTLAADYLFNLNKEIELYLTREPTWHSKEIREKMQEQKDVSNDKEWYAERFMEDRQKHSRKDISRNQLRGIHILCNGYKYATLAYQQTQGMKIEELIKMHSRYHIVEPNLIMIYDLPAEIAYERRLKDNPEKRDVFDKDLEFQKRLRQNYLELRNKLEKETMHEENIVIIDANQAIEDVFRETKEHIDKLFGVK